MLNALNILKKHITSEDSTRINIEFPYDDEDVFDEIRPLYKFLEVNPEYYIVLAFADDKLIWKTTHKKVERLELHLKQLANVNAEKIDSHQIIISGNNNNVAINNSSITNNCRDLETLLQIKQMVINELSESSPENKPIVENVFDDLTDKTKELKQKISMVEALKSLAPLISVANGLPMIFEKIVNVLNLVLD